MLESDLDGKYAANQPAGLAARSLLTSPAQSAGNGETPLLTPMRGVPNGTTAAGSHEAARPSPANGSQTLEETPWPQEPERRDKKRRGTSSGDQAHNWLRTEPHEWVGRKVRNRSTAAIYTVRQVYKNDRVQLEKNWMSYMSDVDTIRAGYEAYGG
jgi:hypothetical protein